MKQLLPLVMLTLAAGASCGFDRQGLPGEGLGGAPTSTSTSTSTGGAGGEATGTTSSAASTATGGSVWTRRRLLSLDSGISSSLTDFPLMVPLSKSTIDYTQTQSGGQDLRFTDDQGTLLDYEIERWAVDDTTPSVIWVRLLDLLNSFGHRPIWMYYGNAQAPAAQNVPGVWKDGFVGVWHLSQDDMNLIDSTGKSPPATNHGATMSAGIIGNARSFSAFLHQYVDTLNTAQLNRFTIEAWAYGAHDPTTSNGPNGLVMREKNYQIAWDHVDPFLASANFNPTDPTPNGQNWQLASFNGLTKMTWVYLAATFDGSRLTAYKDGVKTNSTIVTSDPQMESETAKIGRQAYGMDDASFFDGVIDEVRISDKTHLGTWFTAQNRSMRNDGFITFGSEEVGTYSLP